MSERVENLALSIGDCVVSCDGTGYRLESIEPHPSGILSCDLKLSRTDSNVIYTIPEPMMILMIENGTYSVI